MSDGDVETYREIRRRRKYDGKEIEAEDLKQMGGDGRKLEQSDSKSRLTSLSVFSMIAG